LCCPRVAIAHDVITALQAGVSVRTVEITDEMRMANAANARALSKKAKSATAAASQGSNDRNGKGGGVEQHNGDIR
jgi:hypothetical protein